jgi:hypothetical protein
MHKRPEGQNLWGNDRSAVDFEVKVSEVEPLRSEERQDSKVLAGSPIVEFSTPLAHVR